MPVASVADDTDAFKCIECGATISSKAKFCLNCGAAQRKATPASIKCVGCSAEIPEFTKFCEHCGAVQSASPPNSSTQVAERLPESVKTCVKCRADNPAEYSYCSKCGLALSNTASGAAVHSPGTATRQPDPNFRPRVENDAAKQLTVQSRPAPSAEHQHPAVEPAKMTPQQKLYFQQEYDKLIRNPSTALILTLLLGGFGAHRFYLKQWGWGIAYIFFVWTFIPVIVSIIECFLIMQRTRDYNEQCSRGIMEKMNVIFSEPEIAVAMRLR
jgi:TM2 domain-containing membrane protein YozV/ribosomal protein L40E